LQNKPHLSAQKNSVGGGANVIFDIDTYMATHKVRLYIAKPDQTIIGEITEYYDLKRNTKLGNIPTLSLSLPYQINIRNKLVDNPAVQATKNRYLIKFVQDTTAEWYIIKAPSDIMGDSSDYKSIEAYGLAYELADKNLRSYSVVSKNASQVLQDVLASTLWSIGTIDASFDILYRSFEVSDSNVLDFIFEAATTFNALVNFDTVQRRIDFLIFEQYGTNRGLEVAYGHLLKSASKVENSDEFFTRLKVFGANGSSILGENITGQNYLEDYSYFIYPFSRDSNKNILTHSDYMSDSLCHALLDYSELVTSKDMEFKSYLGQLSEHQNTLIEQKNQLKTYKDALASIENEIANLNYLGQNTSEKVIQKIAKEAEISAQNGIIASTENSLNTVNSQIAQLQNSLSISSNFTPELIKEWNPYIIMGTFENTTVTDPVQLLSLAEQEFEKLKRPKIVVNISIVNFLECVTEQQRWGMLNLGDIITIKQSKLGLHIQAKIIEMNFDYEAGDVSLVISNVKELLSDEARFLRDLYKANTTSASVGSGQYKWDAAYTDVNDVQAILNDKWDATAREIQASVDNTVSISRKGLIVTDPNDADKMLILQKGLLAISGNGGNTWDTAIDPSGVFAKKLVGQIMLGNDLYISNSAGTVSINANGMVVSDMDLTVTNDKSKVKINPNDGILIQKNTGTAGVPNWSNQISLDGNGDALFSGKVQIGSGNSMFLANESGISLGASAWANAPFRVSPLGVMTATSANVTGSINCTSLSINGNNILSGNQINGSHINAKGITVSNGSQTTFSVDANGNVGIYGNINMTGGSISWGSVGAPGYNQISGSKPPINADNTYGTIGFDRLTKITSTGIYTGTIDAYQINTVGLAVEKIFQAGKPNNYTVLGGDYSDLVMYYNNAEYFRVYNTFSSVYFQHKGNFNIQFNNNISRPQNTWDFSNANVSSGSISISAINGLQSSLDGKSSTSHNHGNAYLKSTALQNIEMQWFGNGLEVYVNGSYKGKLTPI
jgi:phage minor structural protein